MLEFDRERALGGVAAGEIEGAAAQDGDVGGAIILTVAGGIFPELNGKLPVQGVLDLPMCADGGHEDLGCRHPGQREMAGLGLHFAIGFPAGLDTAECLQAGKFMVLRQTLSRNHRAGAGLLAAMPGLLVMRDRMVWWNLAETGPSV